MLWLYIILGGIGYIFMGIVVGRCSYNHHIDKYFQERLESSASDYDVDSIEYYEQRLEQAKNVARSRDADFGAVVGGAIWPGYLPILTAIKIAKAIPNVKFMQSKAERTVTRMKDTKAIADKKKKEWSLALHTMEEAGIDTKELRKMKIE
jgi:hypothetical protein